MVLLGTLEMVSKQIGNHCNLTQSFGASTALLMPNIEVFPVRIQPANLGLERGLDICQVGCKLSSQMSTGV